jgi:hypothetical protein
MSAHHRLHVIDQDGEVAVWLDTDLDRCDGICLACGTDRAAVLVGAKAVLVMAIEKIDRHLERAQRPTTGESRRQWEFGDPPDERV